jgi:O-acetyl-ADP-ribose deacetylase (regulator of RNase III)
MSDFLKQVFANIYTLMLSISVVLLLIAVLGFIPLGTGEGARIPLNGIQRFLFVAIALGVPLVVGLVKYILRHGGETPPTDAEYHARLEAAKVKTESITPEEKIRFEREIRNVRIVIYNADISTSKSEVLVSSDDNYLQAKGGVAKAILQNAGVEKELEYYRKYRPRLAHGDLAVTTGGLTGARAIIHPAVIDLDENRYPNQILIRKVVRRSLACAVAFGARSIAFPVLGGGTASKYLKAPDSIKAILAEIITFTENYELHSDGELKNVALYVYDPKDIIENLESLFLNA